MTERAEKRLEKAVAKAAIAAVPLPTGPPSITATKKHRKKHIDPAKLSTGLAKTSQVWHDKTAATLSSAAYHPVWRELRSRSDDWEAQLLMHLAHPLVSYQLPGVRLVGTANHGVQTATGGTPDGPPQSQELAPWVQPQTLADTVGQAVDVAPVNTHSLKTSQYDVKKGLVVSEYTVNPLPGSLLKTTTVWIMFDPYNVKEPLYISQADSTPWELSGANSYVAQSWSANPHLLPQKQVLFERQPGGWSARAGDRAGPAAPRATPPADYDKRFGHLDEFEVVGAHNAQHVQQVPRGVGAPQVFARYSWSADAANYCFVGGATLIVRVQTRTGFASVAMKSRSASSTFQRFYQNVNFDNSDTGKSNGFYGDYTLKQMTDAGYAAYSGTLWDQSLQFNAVDSNGTFKFTSLNSVSVPPAPYQTAGRYFYDRIRQGVQIGLPLVELTVTTPSDDGAVAPVTLAIRGDAWVGTAANTVSVAAALPECTAPAVLPDWFAYGAVRGAVGDNVLEDAVYAAGDAIHTAAQEHPGDTMMGKALASTDKAVNPYELPTTVLNNRPKTGLGRMVAETPVANEQQVQSGPFGLAPELAALAPKRVGGNMQEHELDTKRAAKGELKEIGMGLAEELAKNLPGGKVVSSAVRPLAELMGI